MFVHAYRIIMKKQYISHISLNSNDIHVLSTAITIMGNKLMI